MFVCIEPNGKDGKPKKDYRNDKVLKSYILSKTVVKRFEDTCDRLGVNKSVQMNKLMTRFVNENK